MDNNSPYYFDSHGCRIAFIARKDNMLIALKKRKFVYVLPEVVEIIERIEQKGGREVTIENISCELCVHPIIIRSIFVYLRSRGLLGKEEPIPANETHRNCVLPDMKKEWSGNIYPILRSVKEEDYGKIIKPQEKERGTKTQSA